MGALKGKELETALFSVAVLLNGFLLWKAVHLKFMVRNMLGPGAYPTAVLVIALVISIVLLVQVVRRREIRVLSPFLGGSPLDVRVKRLCAAATGLGQPVRIVSRTGVGRFSAFARGIASADGAVTVVTSALAEISNLHAAAFALRNFSPVLCIDHDPDMLVARDGSPWMDAATVLTHRGTLRVGIAQTAEESSPVEAWLGKAANLDLAPTYDEDWQNLVEAPARWGPRCRGGAVHRRRRARVRQRPAPPRRVRRRYLRRHSTGSADRRYAAAFGPVDRSGGNPRHARRAP